MKLPLVTTFLCLSLFSFGQLTFEQVESPEDFNIKAIFQSPQGEYFTQAFNDQNSIYSSLDGQNWTKADLPVAMRLANIDFLGDGTPVISAEFNGAMIRRDGEWHTMILPAAWDEIEATFPKGDSLFFYYDGIFGYSLDKGETFTLDVGIQGSISDHSSHLWKFDNHYVLHHTAGATDWLSVFDMDGISVMQEGMFISYQDGFLNECNEILILGYDNYYSLKEDGLLFEAGLAESIIPNHNSGTIVVNHGSNYYYKDEATIYKSTNCNFDWTPIATDDEVEENSFFWINAQEDIYLFNERDDKYFRRNNGASDWNEEVLNIDYAYVLAIEEAHPNQQFSVTTTGWFNKNITDQEWSQIQETDVINRYEVEYSPNGNLYINDGSQISYSEDNGLTFNIIDLPSSGLPVNYSMYILADDFIFIYEDLFTSSVYYSINNGADWIQVNDLLITDRNVEAKLIDDYILVVENEFEFSAHKIDLNTNEVDTHISQELPFTNIYNMTITNDGTVYFHIFDLIGAGNTGLYRYTFDQGAELIAPELTFPFYTVLSNSVDDIYVFGDQSYFNYNGDDLVEYEYNNLPESLNKKFVLAQNQFLYIIIDDHIIYRSTEPLALPQYISGSIYNDINEDCTDDPTEDKLKYWNIKVENDDYLQIKTTNFNGEYKFSVPYGDYTLTALPINNYWELCEPTFDVTIDENNTIVNQDFQAKTLVDCAVLEIDFSSPFLRRCFDNYYSVRVLNTGPLASAGTILTMELDPFFNLQSVTVPFTQIDVSTIEIDLGVIEVNEEITFKILFNLSCDAELGAEHCLSGSLDDANLCQDLPLLQAAAYTECQENIGSYDPNDKRIFNEAGQEVSEIDKDEFIYYHIRFQNTGTDTAFTVRILDPLSPILDLSTFAMLSASHNYTYSINDGPELEVVFNDILLPDSTTNEPESHGFFKFKIKPLPEYDYGTSIPNQAGIYFDFNDPVITNEAVLLIMEPLSTSDLEPKIIFDVFPNPATKELTLEISAPDLPRINNYEITNQYGQVIKHQSILSTVNSIDISMLSAGIYYVVLKDEETVIGAKKFVKID